jgi:hypothetical protein
MPQADTARSQLFFLDEDLSGVGSWGATPAATNMIEMRFTGESLKHDKGTAQSAEIRSDRQIPDIVEVSAGASGDVNLELSYGAYDAFLEGALQDEWTDVSNQQTTTFDQATKAITGTGVGTDVVVGQWIRVRDSNDNDGWWEVTAASANSITVRESTLTDEVATVDVYIEGSFLRNSTIEKSFSMEKLFSDLTTGKYTNFTGMEVAQLALNIVADQMVTGTMSFLGKEGINADATIGAGVTAASTNDVLNATSNVGEIREGATPAVLSTALQGVNFTINNNLRARRAIGNRTAIGIGQGRCVVTGNVNAYFEDGALYQKMIAHTASYLSVRLHDGDVSTNPEAANSLFITFHRVKFTGGDPLAGAADQDVMANLSFQAVRDPTSGIDCTVQFDRFASA